MPAIVDIQSLSKVYQSGHQTLSRGDLQIEEGEILALLGPNGAGKTTLISIICGIVLGSSGSVRVAGHDIVTEYRMTRKLIGLVPQELTLGAFDIAFSSFFKLFQGQSLSFTIKPYRSVVFDTPNALIVLPASSLALLRFHVY